MYNNLIHVLILCGIRVICKTPCNLSTLTCNLYIISSTCKLHYEIQYNFIKDKFRNHINNRKRYFYCILPYRSLQLQLQLQLVLQQFLSPPEEPVLGEAKRRSCTKVAEFEKQKYLPFNRYRNNDYTRIDESNNQLSP